MRAFFHRFFAVDSPWSWRRLLAFIVGTALLLVGRITEDAWVMIAVTFMGAEVLTRGASVLAARRDGPANE